MPLLLAHLLLLLLGGLLGPRRDLLGHGKAQRLLPVEHVAVRGLPLDKRQSLDIVLESVLGRAQIVSLTRMDASVGPSRLQRIVTGNAAHLTELTSAIV